MNENLSRLEQKYAQEINKNMKSGGIVSETMKIQMDLEGSDMGLINLNQEMSSSGDDNYLSSNRQQYSDSLETVFDFKRPS